MTRNRHGTIPAPQRSREHSGLAQIYGEELDNQLSEVQREISQLREETENVRPKITSDNVMMQNKEIENSIEDFLQRANKIRSSLLAFKKDGKSSKATLYEEVLEKFKNTIQGFEYIMETYEKLLQEHFKNPEHSISVKQIGDAHYLFRENALSKFGFEDTKSRNEKLIDVHTKIAQLKVMIVGLEFLFFSDEN